MNIEPVSERLGIQMYAKDIAFVAFTNELDRERNEAVEIVDLVV